MMMIDENLNSVHYNSSGRHRYKKINDYWRHILKWSNKFFLSFKKQETQINNICL